MLIAAILIICSFNHCTKQSNPYSCRKRLRPGTTLTCLVCRFLVDIPGTKPIPYSPRRDDDGLFFFPFSNPNQSLINKKKHLLTILNTTHYEQNLRKNLWATGSLS